MTQGGLIQNDVESPEVIINTGSLHPELEETLLHDMQQIKSNNPLEPVVVLAGSRLLCDYLLWLTASRFKALVNVHFVTFARLIRNLAVIDRINDSRDEIPPGGEQLLTGLSSSALCEDSYFSNVKGYSGFHNAAYRTFQNLDDAAIIELPDNLTKIDPTSGKWQSLCGFRKTFIRAVRPFRRQVDDYLTDRNLGADFRGKFGTDRLHVYGIYDFTGSQIRLIDRLSREIALTFYLPFQTDSGDFGSAFDYVKPVFRKLSRLNGVRIKPRNPEGGCANTGFSRKLFCYRTDESSSCHIPGGRVVRIFSAPGRAAEINALVSRINEEALWNGTPLEKIGILLWNPSNYREPLISELQKANIPFCDTIGTRLIETVTGRFTADLLALTGRTLNRDQLITLLASYKMRRLDEDEFDSSAMIKIFNECQLIEGNRKQWIDAVGIHYRRTVDSGQNEEKGESPQAVHAKASCDFLSLLFDHLEEFPEAGSPSEFSNAACRLIETFIPPSSYLNLVIKTVRSTTELDLISTNIERKRYIETVLSLLTRTKTDRGSYRCDGVSILDKMSGRGVRSDVLFIPGLGQDEVPVRGVEDSLLSDFEREQLSRSIADGESTLLPLQNRRHLEEQLLFALSVDSCSERLFLSFSEWDESRGEPRFASRYVLEMCRLLVNRPVAADKLKELPFYQSEGEHSTKFSENRREQLLRRTFCSQDYPLKWIKRFVPARLWHHAVREVFSGRFAAFDRALSAFEARRNNQAFTHWDGLITSYGKKSPLSQDSFRVTDLESYSRCPFHYYIQKHLKAVRWEIPEIELDLPPNVKGELIHRILCEFWKSARSEGRIPLSDNDRDWAVDLMMSQVETVFTRRKNFFTASPAVWRLAQKNIETMLKSVTRWFCQEESSYHFSEAEVTLRKELILPFNNDEFSINLRGRVDRIDYSADGKSTRIIDYKTGKSKIKPMEFLNGETLQLPLYLMMLLDDDPELDVESSETAYFQVTGSGDISSKLLSGKEIMEHVMEIGKVIRTISLGISNGVFIPVPDKNKCERCDSRQMCDVYSRRKYQYLNVNSNIDGFRQMLGES